MSTAAVPRGSSERYDATTSKVAPLAPKRERLLSLDVFRGMTVAGMLLVNDPGTWSAIFPPLEHAEWNGWTPTDLIFPFFLFIVGVAIPLAFGKRIERGDSRRARFFKVLVLLGWPLTVGTFVLVHPIGRLFRLFPQSEASLRILAFAIVFLFANSAFYAMLNATNRQHMNAWATGLAAAINIALNLILIPFYGYLAASATTVVTEASLCVFGWWFVQRHRPELRLPVVGVSWRILLAGAVMGVALYPLAQFPIYFSLPVGGIAYVVAIFLIRAIDADEWKLAREGLLSRLRPSRAA